ncbi:hypothetical protein [Mucilaginibacter sp. CSA2-8R]|uniref:hypothetical protein n=1 Tax=Mucilaginibacter sp. CSA2-8R TaxID=3141542 RepID=UPI00315C98D0
MTQQFSAQDRVTDIQDGIRKMRRLHATFGVYRYKLNPNDNVTINVGGLEDLTPATGWHLDLNEKRNWDVYCYNGSQNDYLVLRCKPYTTYWKVVSCFKVPAQANDVKIETFLPDNEDQWWILYILDANGRPQLCNGEPGGSDASLASDSYSATFRWLQPNEFDIKVVAK